MKDGHDELVEKRSNPLECYVAKALTTSKQLRQLTLMAYDELLKERLRLCKQRTVGLKVDLLSIQLQSRDNIFS